MIQSMTGFGRSAVSVEGAAFELEVRSVNHRHLDARVRLPRWLASLEAEVRTRIGERFSRGKVDLSTLSPEGSGPTPRLVVDLDTARAYLQAAETLQQTEHLPGSLDAAALLALPGVSRFVEPELREEELRSALFSALDEALEAAAQMRETEGRAIDRDLRSRLETVLELADAIEARRDEVEAAVRERLRRRAKQLEQETGLLDEARLHQEVVLAADRLDVSEELVRLRSHVEQFREILASAGPGQPVGRRLDFLLQELGREANTIGSKASDAPVAHRVVELKTELERVREQVQNVE